VPADGNQAARSARTGSDDGHGMKLPDFTYAAPTDLRGAISLLAADPAARALAGGQSLIPVLAFRLGAPSMLVDLSNIPDLDKIEVNNARLRIGAMARWATVAENPLVGTHHPLLRAAISHVAHYQVRNRGTIGGSLAHADPAAELPAIAVACDATIIAQGPQGQRRIAAVDFFLGALTTALAPAELVIALELPCMSADQRWGFAEFSRRRGDFALAGAAVHFSLDAHGAITDPHIAVIGASDRPRRLTATETVLAAQTPTLALLRAAADVATAETDAADDLHGSAAYRRSLAGTMVLRALADACAITLP
jgi:carbon-monoxide dehydrogenase medium subunit